MDLKMNKIRRRLLSALLVIAMIFSAPAAVFFTPAMKSYAEVDQKQLNTTWKMGIAVFSNFIPQAKLFEPLVSPLLDKMGVMLKEINKNINQLRDEMNERLDDLEKGLNQSTMVVLNKIRTENFINGLGTELDKLHTAIEGVSRQITTLKNDSSLTEEERAIGIAAQIGKNTEWNKDGSLVFRIKTIGNVLAGKSFADMGGRDLYTIVYDNAAGDVMFSGEAYDVAAPYVDRVMYEYLLAYSVMTECFEAADTVSAMTDDQVAALSAKAKNDYYATVSTASLVEDEILSITDQIFNASSANSVVSHYAAFNYNKVYDRNNFINRGTTKIPIGSIAKVKPALTATNKYNDRDSLLTKAKNEVNAALNSSDIHPKDIKTIYNYYREKYPDITFVDYLYDSGINAVAVATSDTSTFLPISDKENVDDERTSSSRKQVIGFTGFDPRVKNPSEKKISFYTWKLAGSSSFYFGPENSGMLVFRKTESVKKPVTAEEIVNGDASDGVTVKLWKNKGQRRPAYFFVGGPEELVTSYGFQVLFYDRFGNEIKYDSKYVWESQQGPDKGIHLKENGMVSFTKPGAFQVRVKVVKPFGETVYSNWFGIATWGYGNDEELPADSESTGDIPVAHADQDTTFVIRNSYTGLVGAEPDRIYTVSQPVPPSYLEGEETEPEGYPYHQRLMVDAYDKTMKEIRVAYTWEAEEAEGISLTGDGMVSFSEEGAYKVRIRSGEYVSDWYWVNAVTESEEYATIAFCDEDETAIASITLPWGTKVTPPSDPDKAGYIFMGWSQTVPEKMPADDMSIYATWKAKNGWSKENGKWIYYDNGTSITGWKKTMGKWYYLDPDGYMATGWREIGGIRYYFDQSSGAMATGWKKINDRWYYFAGSGAMASKEWRNGYWLSADGVWNYEARGSWHKNSKGWWYGDTTGWYAKNQWEKINGSWYFFDAEGYMVTGTCVINGMLYIFSEDGVWKQ